MPSLEGAQGGSEMATNSDSSIESETIRKFVEESATETVELGEPLSTDTEDPLLDRERIELDEEVDEE